jgi:hypothetical protein
VVRKRLALGRRRLVPRERVLYDGPMGYSMTVTQEPGSEMWVVAVKADLTRAETNELFLSGDSMVSWPDEGLDLDDDPRLQRSAMFVSEVAARPQGLRIRYREESQARRAATLLRIQFGQIGIREET